jgi:hypothetical protein
MVWSQGISYFFGGLFLTNAIPHFVSGVMGKPFQTPFASPPGKGLSSSLVNVLWGFFNLVVSYFLICKVGDFAFKATHDVLPFAAGILLMGLFSAHNFGKLHGGNLTHRV